MDTESEREFCRFVAARSQALFRSAYLLTGQTQAAEDLVQTALTKLAARWSRVDQPEAYVRRIMYHYQVTRSAKERSTTPGHIRQFSRNCPGRHANAPL